MGEARGIRPTPGGRHAAVPLAARPHRPRARVLRRFRLKWQGSHGSSRGNVQRNCHMIIRSAKLLEYDPAE